MDGNGSPQGRPERARVFLGCRKVEWSIAFYWVLFQMPIRWFDGAWRVRLPAEEIEFHELPHQKLAFGAGTSDFDFGVLNLEETLRRLRRHGLKPTPTASNVFLDPDGRRIRVVSVYKPADN